MNHTATISLTKKEYKPIKDSLEGKKRTEYSQLAIPATFDDGMVMHVKCVASQYGACAKAVLLKPDADGLLTEVSETPATDKYLGEWVCEYEGDTYTVTVKLVSITPVKFADVCEDCFTDICPDCNNSFSSQFGQCVCSHCGSISAGCDACPGESNNRIDCSKCPVSIPVRLYGIFKQKEFDSLPDAYKGAVSHKANNWFIVLINNRVHHIYSERKVVGITTIDMDQWRKGNRFITNTATIEDILK